MAPIDEYAVVTVLTTQVKAHDEKSILVEAGGFAPMRWFLTHAADSAPHDDVKRPRKRRKLKHDDQPTHLPSPPSVTRSDGEIPIHRVTIDLHFPATLGTRQASEEAIRDDVDLQDAVETLVMPYGIDEGSGGTMRFTKPEKQSAILMIDTSRIPKSVLDALRQIALPGQLSEAYAGRRDKTNPATILRCSLRQSVGQLCTVVRLEASVSWRSGSSAFPARLPTGRANYDYEFLSQAYPDQARAAVDHTQPWTPQDFYDCVHVPDKSIDAGRLPDNILESELYPFQKRAVNWMLEREGVERRDDQTRRIPKPERRSPLSFYEPVADLDGQSCYVNYLQGIISREKPVEDDGLPGGFGLLAEEMGLGKTVEVLALVAVNTRPEFGPGKVRDVFTGTAVIPSKATLIITPPSILQQWRSELNRHAPALRVYQYNGIPGSGKESKADADLVRDLSTSYDVVLATYPTLGRELHFAENPPERNMRHARKFDRRRSPLVQIQWWRVCLDEAQMVESGVTAAARVACRLPRVHSWAVTGTPLRKNVSDLHGLLIFLRYQPFSSDAKLWSHLITNHRHLFRRIFGEIALRHTKAHPDVRDELHLPPQKRVVLTVPFSTVEQQHYATLLTEMCNDVGLNSDGSPKDEAWDPQDARTIETMRMWLVRLRQTCLHPQVGGHNRKALGRGQGPLRTVAEVLQVMIEQNETSTRAEERAVLDAQLSRAHIVGNNGTDIHRSEKALEVYENAMNTSVALVQEARGRLASAKAALAAKGESAEEDEDTSSGRLKANLRTALQLQHVCTFFAATAYYQIKTNEDLVEPDSAKFKNFEELETTLYERAKLLRQEILKNTSDKAEGQMRKISDLAKSGKLTHMPAIKDLAMVGIESRRIVEKSDELFDVIREQVQVIGQWRVKMAEYLRKPLVDEDENAETTGEEYEDSTKQQDELYVYFDAVKAVQADLNTFITGEDAPLIDHEVRMLVRDAKWFLDPDVEFNGVVHAPELLLKLLATRNHFRARKEQVGSVRSLVQEARILENSMQLGAGARSDYERSLVKGHLTALQKIFSDYSKTITGMEKELDLFRSVQNQRLEFYRQLQELSDAVAPYREELDEQLDEVALDAVMEKEAKFTKSLAQLKTKNRFLLHLRDDSGSQSAPRICVICQCSFENGVLTVCGHQFFCKRKLTMEDMHGITYKPKEFKAQEEVQSGFSSPGSQVSNSSSPTQQSSIYSDVDSKLMDEIKTINLPTSYGTKIDTLGRHLHWIREHDPGAKSIVFSQYREFLDVLGTALADFKIGYSRLGRAGAVEKFRHDPSVDCLLLDAKTDSSGLTLVNATHVFICEPLIQTAVELQAIARVHRIGQTRPTTVWMYLINDTVEEAIYDISRQRRLAHVQSRQQSRNGKSRSTTPGPLAENAIDAANSAELQSAPMSKLLVAGKGGGELVGNGDLWQCLFGKSQKARPSVELDPEVGKHLRAEAAVQRRVDAIAGASTG
ncbi:hypothetical protein LTR36_007151 [Oleoguttula mirabilis]|uniref:Uncharacterized protein n=1 Tax=Oleoguttula mirabilis TaxID=1507867 RepID=A0AAV9JBD6_9PEZI|nr:hypothetical protein LTR36_007151 [Oleoguttula mirabilis]